MSHRAQELVETRMGHYVRLQMAIDRVYVILIDNECSWICCSSMMNISMMNTVRSVVPGYKGWFAICRQYYIRSKYMDTQYSTTKYWYNILTIESWTTRLCVSLLWCISLV